MNVIFCSIYNIFLAVAIGQYHAKQADADEPIWPAKLFINIGLGFGLNPSSKEWLDKELSRKDFSFLEQFMAATVVWFVIIFFAFLVFAGLYMPIFFKQG